MLTTLLKRAAFIACVALAVLAIGLTACESEPTRTADGPPPAGYDSWEDYWETQDELRRDTDTQLDQQRRQRDTAAPKPY